MLCLSGKDEKPITTIPACPICGKVPEYWILDGIEASDSYIGWLLSDQYIKEKRGTDHSHVLINKLSKVLDFVRLLQKMGVVRCPENWRHKFSKDTPLFCDVKVVLERYNAKEGFQYH